jgi:hypothetical protein
MILTHLTIPEQRRMDRGAEATTYPSRRTLLTLTRSRTTTPCVRESRRKRRLIADSAAYELLVVHEFAAPTRCGSAN